MSMLIKSPLSLLYESIVRCRRGCYERGIFRVQKLSNAPVISVGNLMMGGTGKTPFVKKIAEIVKNLDMKTIPLILTRGYGNDENHFLSHEMEILGGMVAVDANRYRAASKVLNNNKGSEFVGIMDDGFQHLRLFRDLDVVMINCLHGLEEYRVVPAGFMREPLSSLSKADVIVLHHHKSRTRDFPVILEKIKSHIRSDTVIIRTNFEACEIVTDICGQIIPFSELVGKKVMGVCGIGCPEGFRNTLTALTQKEDCVLMMPFADHHAFSSRDIDEILRKKKGDDYQVIITEKDAYRGERLLARVSPWILKGNIEFESEDDRILLTEKIAETLKLF